MESGNLPELWLDFPGLRSEAGAQNKGCNSQDRTTLILSACPQSTEFQFSQFTFQNCLYLPNPGPGFPRESNVSPRRAFLARPAAPSSPRPESCSGIPYGERQRWVWSLSSRGALCLALDYPLGSQISGNTIKK